MHRRSCLEATSSVHYTTSCKHSLVLLRMGEIIARNMLSWLKLLINCYCCILLVVYTTVSEMRFHTNVKHQIYVCVYEFRNCTVRQTGGCEQSTDTDGVCVWSQRKQSYGASDDGAVCARQRQWSSLESEASKWNDSTQSYSCGDQLSVTSLPHIVQSCRNSWREQKHFR